MPDSYFSPSDEQSCGGGAFGPGLKKGKVSGTIRVTDTSVVFETEDGRVELPLRGLEVSLGGAADRLLFFRHSDKPDWSVFTPDHHILRAPAFSRDPQILEQARGLKRKKNLARAVVIGVLVLAIGAAVLIFLMKDLMVRSIAARIPVEWEVKVGGKVSEQVLRGSRELTGAEALRQFERVTQPLVRAIPDQGYAFEFHIIEDPEINAFALPGGPVVIHTGLLLAAESPEEVAGVLAHEIAHVTRRHGFQRVIESAGIFLLVQAFLGDVSGVLAVLADNATFLVNQKFSRDMEREADDLGWAYLTNARIDPRGMITLFEKLQAEQERLLKHSPIGKIEKGLGLLSTHPDTEERIARLKEKWRESAGADGFTALEVDLPALQESLRSQLHLTGDTGETE